MADRYKAKAIVTIIKEVEVFFEDNGNDVLEDQARGAVLKAAHVSINDDSDFNFLTFKKANIKKSSDGDVGLAVFTIVDEPLTAEEIYDSLDDHETVEAIAGMPLMKDDRYPY